jgi:hypothetical protein
LKKFILNVFINVLTESEEAVLMMGFYFSTENLHSNLDMVYAVNLVISNLSQILAMEF